MLVVADSSPIIVLVQIGHVQVLPALFQTVVAPPQVLAELSRPTRPESVRRFAAEPPRWFVERAPATVLPIKRLQAGEEAAISLALELKADLLLIDEAPGRRAALERQVPITGTIGVLERAAAARLLDLEKAFEAVARTDFWISEAFLEERLRLFRSQRPGT